MLRVTALFTESGFQEQLAELQVEEAVVPLRLAQYAAAANMQAQKVGPAISREDVRT